MNPLSSSRDLGRSRPGPARRSEDALVAADDAETTDGGLFFDPCFAYRCSKPARNAVNFGDDHNPTLRWACDEHVRTAAFARWAMHVHRLH